MDLLAISYKNIGPFKGNKIKNIFFKKGKYLIKAPIGSGKSFLFFDGPVYALYKYNSRNILNTDSSEGFIKLVFEQDDQKFLIIRNLEQGKTKDTCKSQLFTIEGNIPTSEIDGQDIQQMLLSSGAILNEIIFKNETDLDGSLASYLPPREVFLSTVFLLQDSENIFELRPADRLTVMKNIFNLIGIDDVKEQISDKKRDIQTTLKIKSDTTIFDNKIKLSLINYISNFKNIENKKIVEITDEYKNFVAELEMIAEKVNITDFSIEGFDKSLHTKIDEKVSENKKEYQGFLVNLQNTENQIKEQKSKLDQNIKERVNAESKISEIDKKINTFDPENINEKKTKKITLFNEIEKLSSNINYDVKISEILSELKLKIPHDLEGMNELINQITQEGRSFAEQKKLKESQIENEKLKQQSWTQNLELEIKNLGNNKDRYSEQLKNAEQRILEMNNTINKQSQFECIKINSSCPFIKEINKDTFSELERQKGNIEKERQDLIEKIEKTDLELKNKQDLLKQGNSNVGNLSDLMNDIEKIDRQMMALRGILAEINFKEIQEKYQKWKGINNEINLLDKEIMNLEANAKDLENLKAEKIKLSQQIENFDTNKNEISQEIKRLEEIKITQQGIINKFDISIYNNIDNWNKSMERSLHEIEVLVNDFKENSIAINKLKQDEIMIKNLYQIFSKELLLFVLEGYLPTLTEIINVLLAQVVDYTIDIKLKQKGENLEMDIKVFDDKGERDIKALSGGQKVILKLVWMLAISNYIKSPMLFMDETINNLDQDTVGKVADMLGDFVKLRDIKLYTVTHSQQIQDMDIWDEVIEIKN